VNEAHQERRQSISDQAAKRCLLAECATAENEILRLHDGSRGELVDVRGEMLPVRISRYDTLQVGIAVLNKLESRFQRGALTLVKSVFADTDVLERR
jgi:hypothetical protein